MEPANFQGPTSGSFGSSLEGSPRTRSDSDERVQKVVSGRLLTDQSSSPLLISEGIKSPTLGLRPRAGSLASRSESVSPTPSVKSTIEEGMGRMGFSKLFFQVLGDPEGGNITACDVVRPFDRVGDQHKIEGEYVLHMQAAKEPTQPIGYRAITPLFSQEGTKYDDYNILIRRNIKALCLGAKVQVPETIRCIVTQSPGDLEGFPFSVSFPDPDQSVILSTKDLPADVAFLIGGNLNHTLSKMNYNPQQGSLEVTLRDRKTGEERVISFPDDEKALALWEHIWRKE